MASSPVVRPFAVEWLSLAEGAAVFNEGDETPVTQP